MSSDEVLGVAAAGVEAAGVAVAGVAGAVEEEQGAGAPLSGLVGLLSSLTLEARAVAGEVTTAATDPTVRMADLATLIQAINQLGRACAGIEAMATAGFARRDDALIADAPEAADCHLPPERVRALGFVHDDAGLELAHVLAISEGSGTTRAGRAAELTNRMPLTLAAVVEGRVEMWQALQILDECRLLDDEQAREVDRWLAARLGGIEPTRLRAATRYAIGRVDPERIRRRAAKSRRDRTLEITPASDPGLSQVYALIPSHHAAAIWEAASALAKEYQELDPSLTADQARADAFVDLVLSEVYIRAHVTLGLPIVTGATSAAGEGHERTPDPTRGKSPEDYTSEDLDRLFGPEPPPPSADPPDPDPRDADPRDADPRDAHRSDATTRDHDDPTTREPDDPPIPRDVCGPDPDYEGPGTVPDRIPDWMLDPAQGASLTAPIHGTGPLAGAFTSGVTVPRAGYIPADVIAQLLERLDLTISRALIDASDGTVVETVSRAYTPPRAMREFVVVRDGQCRMFGCSRPAAACDLDHASPHADGGPTSPANLAGLCRHHHRAKQARHWTYRLDPETGSATWVNTRTGTVRSTEPATALAAYAIRLRQAVQRLPYREAVASATPDQDPEPPPF